MPNDKNTTIKFNSMVLVTYNIGQVNVEYFYILPPLPLPALRPLERDLFFLICTYRGSPSVLCIAFFKLEAKNDRPKRIGGIYLQFNMS